MYFTFFWLFCGLWVGLGGALYGKHRAKNLVTQGEINADEVNPLLLGFFIFTFIPTTLMWLLQLSISGNPEIDFLTWPSPQKYIALLIVVSVWTALLGWVLIFKGAETLSKVLMLVGNFPKFFHKPIAVKLFAIAMVLSGAVGLFYHA